MSCGMLHFVSYNWSSARLNIDTLVKSSVNVLNSMLNSAVYNMWCNLLDAMLEWLGNRIQNMS